MSDPHPSASPILIVMGVTGSGKTTIGQLLARRLELPFYDADDFHPPANREKLKAGLPLNDGDRAPWLRALAAAISRWEKSGGAVLACSALKEEYRHVLTGAHPAVRYMFLTGDKHLIASRLARRHDHLVKDFSAILGHQFRDLQPPSDAIQVSISPAPDEIVDNIMSALKK